MPKYAVTLVFDSEYICEVEADTKYEAFEKACHVCTYDLHFNPLHDVWIDNCSIERVDIERVDEEEAEKEKGDI